MGKAARLFAGASFSRLRSMFCLDWIARIRWVRNTRWAKLRRGEVHRRQEDRKYPWWRDAH